MSKKDAPRGDARPASRRRLRVARLRCNRQRRDDRGPHLRSGARDALIVLAASAGPAAAAGQRLRAGQAAARERRSAEPPAELDLGGSASAAPRSAGDRLGDRSGGGDRSVDAWPWPTAGSGHGPPGQRLAAPPDRRKPTARRSALVARDARPAAYGGRAPAPFAYGDSVGSGRRLVRRRLGEDVVAPARPVCVPASRRRAHGAPVQAAGG